MLHMCSIYVKFIFNIFLNIFNRIFFMSDCRDVGRRKSQRSSKPQQNVNKCNKMFISNIEFKIHILFIRNTLISITSLICCFLLLSIL